MLISRKSWGAQYRAGFGARALPTSTCWLHHSVTLAPDLAFTDLNADSQDDDEVKAMRAIEAIGQQRFGAGFSYNVAAMPSGRMYEGCGEARVGAHTHGRNTTAFGLVLVGNYQNNRPTEQMVNAVAAYLADAHRRGVLDSPKFDGGHRDLKQTACPGQHAYYLIPEINKRAVQPVTPVQEDDMEIIGPGANPNLVRLVQNCLLNEARVNGRPNPLPKFGADGDYGNETQTAIREYQAGRGIKTSSPGLVGGVTFGLLARYENR